MRKQLPCWYGLFAYLLLTIGAARPGYAQSAGWRMPNQPAEAFNCYPVPADRPGAPGHRPASASRNTGYNPNGYDITPRGDLRVLIIYAGFTNDIDSRAVGYSGGPWPQTDANHPVPGTSFPTNAGGGFYTSASQFSSSATDQTISNFYYQMSQFSTSPLRMYATVFPKRINVTADAATDVTRGFYAYTDQVMQALKNDPATANFNFGQVDNRQGRPNFQTDNSVPGTDQVVDYAIVVWRNAGQAYGLTTIPVAGGGGWASVSYTDNIPSSDGKRYEIYTGFTHTAGLDGVNPPLFVHEFAHTIYSSPHYLLANGVVGQHFNATEGPGMMGYFRSNFSANAWERWFNGWAELQASGVSTDIQDANSLAPTSGLYTLRDFVTTGDMVRIKLPGASGQYLWLENHQDIVSPFGGSSGNVFNDRYDFIMDGQTPSQPFPNAPRGIIAMVEDVSSNRNLPLDYFDDQGVNGLKVLSAQGNFDYTHSTTTSTYNNHLYGIPLYNFTDLIPNPFGGESQISRHRFDADGNGRIVWNPTQGNSGGPRNEQQFSVVVNGQFEDGILGPDIGYNQVGQKLGLSYPTPIFEHQHYDSTAVKLSSITLGGLSVELVGKRRKDGAITIRVRYDDAEVVANTRWTGDLVLAPGLSAGVSGASLTINKSGTPNRHLPTAAGDFINPTRVLCPAGTTFYQNAGPLDTGSGVSLEGDKTTFQVAGTVHLATRGNTFVVGAGTLLELFSGSVFQLDPRAELLIEAGGTLLVHSGATIQGAGTLTAAAGSYLCVEPGAAITATRNFNRYNTGTNPSLGLSGQNCQTTFLVAPAPTSTQRSLYTATPNPANDRVSLALLLQEAGDVTISLQDLSGVSKLRLAPRSLEAGTHTLEVPLQGVPTGVYMLVVESPEGRQVTRLQVNH